MYAFDGGDVAGSPGEQSRAGHAPRMDDWWRAFARQPRQANARGCPWIYPQHVWANGNDCLVNHAHTRRCRGRSLYRTSDRKYTDLYSRPTFAARADWTAGRNVDWRRRRGQGLPQPARFGCGKVYAGSIPEDFRGSHLSHWRPGAI